MPKPILITSVGRTATKWLAECLGWDHEPKKFDGCAVSPTHLHQMAINGWEPPKGTKFAVITRQPEDQMLSIINRWHAVHSPSFKDIWLDRLPRYLTVLNRLVENGAGVMRYEKLTCDHRTLLSELQWAGMPTNGTSWSTDRYNTHPKVHDKLPAWAKAVAWDLGEHYKKWHDHDTRSA